jgi:DNA mismatch repair protein MutS
MADSAGAPSSSREIAVTPFMAQYLAAKDKHPDALLFFRMGDFYELFFEDAEKAAAALDITLTRRGQHGGAPIPMAGVPWHQAEPYIARLIKAGFKVAVCEQLEDPAEAKKRGSKSIVRRDVVRVVTPGTLTEESLLDARRANILAALTRDGDWAALATADVSTGACVVEILAWKDVAHAFAALNPAEVLTPDFLSPDVQALCDTVGAAMTPLPAIKADARAGERRAKALFDVATLEAFGEFTDTEFSALGLLIDYVELTQAGLAAQLAPPQRRTQRATMAIDAATRASLEIDRTQRGTRDGSLLACIDRTITAPGGRLMAARLAAPLTDVGAIQARLDAVAWFVESGARREQVRKELKRAGDLSRALQRLALGRGGPRDLAALRDGLLAGEAAGVRADGAGAPQEIALCIAALGLGDKPDVAALVMDLQRALALDLPLLIRDGGFIAPGYDDALDAARALRDDSRQVIAGLQNQYAASAEQPLKIKHNNVLGYHIDATSKQAEGLMRPPLNALFIHRQTTANAVRFTTTELADLDARIARAGEESIARETAIFKSFSDRAATLAAPIRAAAEALAALDVAAGAAEWAAEWNGVRPEIDETRALLCEGGRHPVVEAALRKQGQGFTANDCRLDGDGQAGARLLFVTGPNMAGKSTYLRQIALMAIMAQAGFYVPARRLRLGVADRVFSRVGANDDLARGRSTFMMEMVETAAILHQAGPRALVVLDEIGRGTATFDGLAIAWAASEHLHDVNGCRAVFATHYHELTVLPERLSAAANAHLRAKEFKGDLIFLHEVAPGAADRSYGIQVAKLAGAPKAVVERAKAVLARLEAGKNGKPVLLTEDLPLFAQGGAGEADANPLRDALMALDPDRMSPREALEALYRLKALSHDA